MSKKSRKKAAQINALNLSEAESFSSLTRKTTVTDDPEGKSSRFASLKRHWWTVLLVVLLALGTLGAGLKYLEDSAQKQATGKSSSSRKENQSWLNSVNPFASAPATTSATPQLSKEYIYAGSRLLAVEDANADVAAPADIAVWRPGNGIWYVLNQETNGLKAAVQFGAGTDKPQPGDYDGDGKTDFCVHRPGDASFYIMKSSDNTFYNVQLGVSTDKPVTADYDGDGKTDAAVYRGSEGKWYILQSSNQGVNVIPFGANTNTDIMQPADYDGDGKADVAVWRTTDKTFYSLNSSNSQLAGAALGQNDTDKPVSADYDGDGRADYAVYSNGNWYIRQSSNNQLKTPVPGWGNATDEPVPNDYDGDGKVDLAVWRGTNTPGDNDVGTWFILNSSNGSWRTAVWGQAGDIPVPVFYRR